MSAPPLQAAPQDDPGQHAADARLHRDALRDLIGMGTNLARLLHDQAAVLATAQARAAQDAAAPQPAPAPAPGAPVPGAPALGASIPSAPVSNAQAPNELVPNAPAPDTLASIAAAFDRTARGVRRGIMLARSLDQPAPSAPDPAAHRAAARRRILREVEDTIQRPGRDGRGGPALDANLQDSLRAELRDRLDGPDLDEDIAGRPVADIITEICRDLGLGANPGTRPFQRRTPDDIRRLCTRAAAPSAARPPAAGARVSGPEDPGQDADQRPPDSQRDNPAATLHTQPGPTHAGSDLPDDPAEAIATILRHHTSAHARWRPPPEA